MKTDNMIQITGVDIRVLIREAYAMSKAQGMGSLHFHPGAIPEDVVDHLMSTPPRGIVVLDMDYIIGRAVKMTVYRDGDCLYIADTWYDHTVDDLRNLLIAIGRPDLQTFARGV